ncbi:MAG: hypothetical protein KC442_07105, partial [Thermomicrobiales bacterium]|nr:hypothetical protein [Thermomicrobiales bacterium]
FSGGKDFHGPQASGLLVGTQRMIDAVAANGSPNQRLARPMKAGKEEMIGLLAAIERYMQVDWRERVAAYEATVAHWLERLNSVPGLTAERVFPNEAGQPTPRCRVRFAPELELSAADAVKQLWDGDPRIAVAADGKDAISFTPELLRDGEANVLLGRIVALASTPVAAD